MGVFREVEIAWGGVDYQVTPSNRLLRRIEANDVIISRMIAHLQTGHPPVGQMAFVIATLLQSAGAKVTEEEILEELTVGDPDEVQKLAVQMLTAITPVQPDPKKPAARARSGNKKKKRAKTTKS